MASTPIRWAPVATAACSVMPGNDVTVTAVWEALPVAYEVYHFKVHHDGTLDLACVDKYQKKAGTTATVADRGTDPQPDVETHVDVSGVVNGTFTSVNALTTLNYTSPATQSLWMGYAHFFPGGTYHWDGDARLAAGDYSMVEQAVVMPMAPTSSSSSTMRSSSSTRSSATR